MNASVWGQQTYLPLLLGCPSRVCCILLPILLLWCHPASSARQGCKGVLQRRDPLLYCC